MTPTSLSSASSQRGFTLLELILVMGIVALAAALVAPNLTGLDSRSFDAQLRDLGAQLNYARRNAIVSGQVSMIELRAQDVQTPDADTIQPHAGNLWSSNSISLAFSADDRREADYEPIDSLVVSFYPEGGTTGGRLKLSQETQRAWVAIDSFTGRITVSREDDR
ncbi:prepilin-type N-terminal cleavage/methylation domain-containing protein [Gammaproteobacteria bacterium]|nr:prepilin-type N-terminal cleavage/methylation domain-containing protein [Gammaproteobacteria bacterium]